jgi:tetratricopeptide (TPR) repeat protein
MRRFCIALTVLTLLGCATSPTSTGPSEDKELSRTASLARAAFEEGATAKAIDLYRRALNRAHAMDDAAAIGNAAYNLALCHIIVGQLDQASALLDEAKAALKRSGGNPGDVLLLEATVAQRQGKLEQALSLADQVLSASPGENDLFQVTLLKGMIACEQHDPARARTMLAEAAQHHVTDAALLGAREQLAGNIYLLESNPAEAATALDRAAALFQEATHYRDMALTLRRAGEAYREAGDLQRAKDRLFRAKRSLAAQGEKAE